MMKLVNEIIELKEGEFVMGFVHNGYLWSQKKPVDILKDSTHLSLMKDRAVMSLIYSEGLKEGKWNSREEFIKNAQTIS